jgi:THO complex subunit 2
LEAFTGAFYKKCPDVEFRGILSYLVHRLKDGHVLELGVLKTLIKTAGSFSFADYSPAASLAESQLEGQAGSLLLKRETFAFGIVESFNFRASARVKSVLQSNNLGVTLLILLAQTRSRLLFEAGGMKKKDVKLIANLLDTCQVVMYILLEFITDSKVSEIAKDAGEVSKVVAPNPIKTYAESLPPLEQLFNSYKLDSVSSWMLCRPIFQAMVAEEKGGNHFKLHEGDRKKVVLQMLPEEAWKDITPTLFDKFFSFSLYDIYFPESCYETELTRLKDTDQRLVHKQKSHQPGVLGMDFAAEDAITLQRVKVTATSLAEDMEKQRKHCKIISGIITSTAKTLFQSKDVSVASVQTFITHCIYPRCRLSPEDATYCVHFVLTLHSMKTPGFSTMHFIDEFLKVLSGSLFSSTEDEAAAIGILLLEFWKIVSKWRYDEKAFKDEVEGTPGSHYVGENGPAPISFEEYKSLYNSWHATIGRATIGCLDSTEYMHVRSCFVILSRIVDAFPTRPKLGQQLLKALGPLQDETYPLPDIMTAAQAYGTLLIKARTNGVWKEEDAATIKAREEKERAAIAQKKKRREEQHAQMKRDTDKLNEEIGEGDRGDRRRGGNTPGDSRRVSLSCILCDIS